MNEKIQLVVNSESTFDSDQLHDSNIDSIQVNDTHFHVLKDSQSFSATIVSGNFIQKQYTVKVNGNTYQIDLKNDLDLLIKQLGFTVGAGKQVNSIKAPMPGLILEISVKVGQEVAENDNLLILEAMKMENNLSSPRAGIIKSIGVEKGDTVDKGQLLIEFE